MAATSANKYQLPAVSYGGRHSIVTSDDFIMSLTDSTRSTDPSCVTQQRYVLFTMVGFAVCCAYALRNNLMIPALFQNSTAHYTHACNIPEERLENQSVYLNEVFAWNAETETVYVSSYYWTFFFTLLTTGYLADQFGGKHFVMVAILGSSICNLFTPLVLSGLDYRYLFVLKILTGFFQGFFLPSVNSVLVYWTPRNMRTTVVCFVYSTIFCAHVLSTLVTVHLIRSSYSWTIVYYIFGSLGMIWCILWQIFCYSRPHLHPFIQFREKDFLITELEDIVVSTRKVVPWRFILRSRPLWALMVNHVTIVWCFFTFVVKMPDYLEQVLRISYEFHSYWTVMLILPTWVIIIIFGCFSDWLIYEKHVDVTVFRRFSIGFAAIGCAIFLLFFVFAQCERVLADISLAIATVFLNMHYTTVLVNYLELAPNFAGIITSICSSFGIVAIVAALILETTTFRQTLEGWTQFFALTDIILIVGGIVYVLLGSGHQQFWNNLKQEERHETE